MRAGHAFLDRGFRPFFAGGAVFSVLSALLWVVYMSGAAPRPGLFENPILWHVHEMIFGFTMAIVAGFLLTAVANWTNWSPVRGRHLFSLFILWLAGRVVFTVPVFPLWLTAAIDVSFIPCLAVSLLVPLWKRWNVRNFVFLGLLSALAACNVLFFLEASLFPLHIALLLITMVVSVVAGRVVPSFTVAWLRYHGQDVKLKGVGWLDHCSFAVSLVLVLLAMEKGLGSPGAGMAAGLLAVLHFLRWRLSYPFLCLKEPMLWILHAGFLWMIAGFAFLALSSFATLPPSLALHALTAGCIGSFTIGMMSRVTLGHTGRAIAASPMTVVAFALMQAAALTRVALPGIFPAHYSLWIALSGVLWAACFLVYAVVYMKFLLRPEQTVSTAPR